MIRSRFAKILFGLVALAAFVYLNNTSIFYRSKAGTPLLVAHRGLAQTFPMEGVTGNTNTAERIFPPEHPYIENTILSMQAAFQAGADVVELDIHPTTDGDFAVFHDWILDYRTDGHGVTRDHSMEELRTVDVGYGYTADQGVTYPFRGKGVGLMPSLDEVLEYFPGRKFLIHIKSNDESEGERLGTYLSQYPRERLNQLTVYGGDAPIASLKEKLPDLRVMSRQTMMQALVAYMALGWTGYMPEGMRNAHFHLPLSYARYLWGWPHRLQERLETANSQLVLVLGDGTWSEGFDTIEDLEKLPEGLRSGIWTNRIDRIGPIYSD